MHQIFLLFQKGVWNVRGLELQRNTAHAKPVVATADVARAHVTTKEVQEVSVVTVRVRPRRPVEAAAALTVQRTRADVPATREEKRRS